MAITRAPDVSMSTAELFTTFVRCAEGRDTYDVLQASVNFLIWSICVHSLSEGGNLAFAKRVAEHYGSLLPAEIEFQWNRQPQATDIPVPSVGN